jgi:Zc3h12a-like Ribonuclease NYN domain
MGDKDMDIDVDDAQSSPRHQAARQASATQSKNNVCLTSAALTLLMEGLQPFVLTSVRAALGEDLYKEYLPPVNADCFALLKYIRNMWLSVFTDTSLNPLSATIDRLTDIAHSIRRAFNPIRNAAVSATISDVQAVLIAIRKSSLAAQVAGLPSIVTTTSGASASSSHLSPALSSRSQEPSPPSDSGHGSTKRIQQQQQPQQQKYHHQHEDPQEQDYQEYEKQQHLQQQHLEQQHRQLQNHIQQPQLNQPQQAGPVAAETSLPPLAVVLDGSNIAWRHGISKRFSYRGIAESLAHFAIRQHPCVVFLPDARMRDSPSLAEMAAFEGELEAFNALKALEGGPQLVLTPDSDYDDRFALINTSKYITKQTVPSSCPNTGDLCPLVLTSRLATLFHSLDSIRL